MFGVRAMVGDPPDTKNTSPERFFVSSVRGCGEEAAEHRKHAHVGMLSMFGMRAMVRDPPDTKTRPQGRVFVFGVKGDGWWTGEGRVGWQEMG